MPVSKRLYLILTAYTIAYPPENQEYKYLLSYNSVHKLWQSEQQNNINNCVLEQNYWFIIVN